PLPDDVSIGSLIGLSNYRTYPVFSWPWWRGRTLFLGAFALLYFLVSWFGLTFARKEYTVELALAASAWSAGEYLLFIMLGPALATWVRTRGWPRRKEAVGIVLVIAAVTVVGSVATHYTDKRLNDQLMSQKEREEAERVRAERSPAAQAAVLATQAVWAGTVLLLLGGGAAAAGYFRERKRLDASLRRRELATAHAARQEAERRLSVLQAQVEPHFLFNTLASVRSLVASDPERAVALIDRFSGYLRASIPRLRADGAAEPATLGQQLDMAVNYLEVMQVRMGERLHYTVQVPAPLRDAPFPPLMLISLVENAVKHGLEPKPAGGSVHITAAREGEQLRVVVADDGVGFGNGATSGSGIGLANIRTQLAQMYGDAARLELAARPDAGFTATLMLPWPAPGAGE
ncbi:MAG: histidine kinase, partial [Betaproteobacteria bacterium]|nr:histidine kinase [Betaproteobacteria bacterium]